MRAFLLLAAVPFALALSGAGFGAASADGVPPGPPAASEAWIMVERSGGFAGITVWWTVAPDGVVRRIEGASGVEVAIGRVADEARAALEALVSARPEPGMPRPATYTCSDCFAWTVTVRAAEDAPAGSWSVRVGELELPEAPALARIIGLVTGEGPGVPTPFR